MCEDQTGLDLEVGDKVIIVGTVTNVTHPPGADYCVATIQYQQNTTTITKPFHGDELVKAEIDGDQISGVLGGQT